jgi:hypothetical protein
MNTLFRSGDYEEAENTIYIEQDGGSILLQYYRLSANALLFIMTNADDFSEAVTLILSKL